MSKKAKKKNNMIKLCLTLFEVALGIAAVIMLAAPVIGIKNNDASYSGWEVTFGVNLKASLGGLSVSTPVLNFSFLNLLTYIFALAAAILLLLKILAPKLGKTINFISCLLFIASGVFFLLTINFTSVGEGFKKIYSFFGTDPKEGLELVIGSILGAVFTFTGAGLTGVELLLVK